MEGGPAADAYLSAVDGLAVGADGSVYVADYSNARVRRIAPDGSITTVAGNGLGGDDGDEGAATAAQLVPRRVALGPDGSLYVSDYLGRLRRVTPDGIIHRFAGYGVDSADDQPALGAKLAAPQGIVVGPDGAVYVAEAGGVGRVRKIGLDGVIVTVAGGGFAAPPGPATSIALPPLGAIALAPDGALYMTVEDGLLRVGTDGILERIAGTVGVKGAAGDGGLATAATLAWPSAVAVDTSGNVFVGVDDVTDNDPKGYPGVRRIDARGIIQRVAGSRNSTCPAVYTCGLGGPATAAQLGSVRALATAPDGSLVVGVSWNVGQYPHADPNTVARLRPALPGVSLGDILLPSADGREAYRFDPKGRHLETRDAVDGGLRYAFHYDGSNRLDTVTDRDGLVTTITRDAVGAPASIVGAYGQATALGVGNDGYLSSITNPNAEAIQLAYSTGGLLATYTDANDHTTLYEFDPNGRLKKATDAAGGSKELVRTDDATGGFAVDLTTRLGHTTRYLVSTDDAGARVWTNFFPGVSAPAKTTAGLDGRSTTLRPDGTTVTVERAADAQFGYLAPVTAVRRTLTPGGRELVRTGSRSAVLADPRDPLTLASAVETVEVNGRAFTTTYDRVTRTVTRTTPEGRTQSATFDPQGRLVNVAPHGRLSLALSYDGSGRVTRIVQGARAWLRTYDDFGRLATVRGPLQCQPDTFHTTCADDAACPANHVCLLPEGACVEDPAVAQCLLRGSSFGYDLANRPTTSTRPDDHVIGTSYDANGNAKTVTPPGRPAHL
ncbi:MAG: hypothetical protein HY908_06950, partial [Myxococcales bacterium]|nr:hypothetical protein [Myxococcales bacterium]